VPAADWTAAHVAFCRRHLLAHKAGVIDQQYLDDTHESLALLGRRIQITAPDVEHVIEVVLRLGEWLNASLPRT
jgi:hypothetical protein